MNYKITRICFLLLSVVYRPDCFFAVLLLYHTWKSVLFVLCENPCCSSTLLMYILTTDISENDVHLNRKRSSTTISRLRRIFLNICVDLKCLCFCHYYEKSLSWAQLQSFFFNSVFISISREIKIFSRAASPSSIVFLFFFFLCNAVHVFFFKAYIFKSFSFLRGLHQTEWSRHFVSPLRAHNKIHPFRSYSQNRRLMHVSLGLLDN